MEQLPGLVARRGSITTRAVGWAIGQLRREHATVHGIARQFGTSWKTVRRAVEPELVKLAEDQSRFENVTTLGVDEHIWHHTDPRKRGPKELTGMVDLSRDSTGKTRARAARPRARPLREGLRVLARRTRRSVPAEREGRSS